jgi:hypothetical protein
MKLTNTNFAIYMKQHPGDKDAAFVVNCLEGALDLIYHKLPAFRDTLNTFYFVLTQQIPTMAVGTKKIVYMNPKFVREYLGADEYQASIIILHEFLHVLFKHPKRGMNFPDIPRKTKNIAMDIEVNNTIIEMRYATSDKMSDLHAWFDLEKYSQKTFETILKIILSEKNDKELRQEFTKMIEDELAEIKKDKTLSKEEKKAKGALLISKLKKIVNTKYNESLAIMSYADFVEARSLGHVLKDLKHDRAIDVLNNIDIDKYFDEPENKQDGGQDNNDKNSEKQKEESEDQDEGEGDEGDNEEGTNDGSEEERESDESGDGNEESSENGEDEDQDQGEDGEGDESGEEPGEDEDSASNSVFDDDDDYDEGDDDDNSDANEGGDNEGNEESEENDSTSTETVGEDSESSEGEESAGEGDSDDDDDDDDDERLGSGKGSEAAKGDDVKDENSIFDRIMNVDEDVDSLIEKIPELDDELRSKLKTDTNVFKNDLISVNVSKGADESTKSDFNGPSAIQSAIKRKIKKIKSDSETAMQESQKSKLVFPRKSLLYAADKFILPRRRYLEDSKINYKALIYIDFSGSVMSNLETYIRIASIIKGLLSELKITEYEMFAFSDIVTPISMNELVEIKDFNDIRNISDKLGGGDNFFAIIENSRREYSEMTDKRGDNLLLNIVIGDGYWSVGPKPFVDLLKKYEDTTGISFEKSSLAILTVDNGVSGAKYNESIFKRDNIITCTL